MQAKGDSFGRIVEVEVSKETQELGPRSDRMMRHFYKHIFWLWFTVSVEFFILIMLVGLLVIMER